MKRTCEYCHQQRTKAGHDPCIADLPGVVFACCGHAGLGALHDGTWSAPYLVERDQNRPTLYGHRAVRRMRELGGNPPDYTGIPEGIEFPDAELQQMLTEDA